MSIPIELDKIIDLVNKHFKETLEVLGYHFSQRKIEGERYFENSYIYTSNSRDVVISIGNNIEAIQYNLFCGVVVHKLPDVKKYENRLFPEYFNSIKYGTPIDYKMYVIDRDKNPMVELERVLQNYAEILFKGDLLEVIKGEIWYENIHVPRD